MSAEPPRAHPVVPGTQPEGVSDEREAASYVRGMFSRIAPRYDLLNHLLSFNLDRLWRRRTVRHFRHILSQPDARVLDLCCGTGDLAFALLGEATRQSEASTQRAQSSTARHGNGGEGASARAATVVGSDFAHPMLTRACEKVHRSRVASQQSPLFLEADALSLPVADSSVDLVTVAFGFRNLANYEAGLREIFRVLRPGGEVGILEFAVPRRFIIGTLYRMYFTQVLPRVGGAISGSRTAYSYLPVSVMKFPDPQQLRSDMRRLGYSDPRTEFWTFGTVALHTAIRG